MAEVQVKTKTSITREQDIPEADVITLLKLDMPNGSVLTGAGLVGKDGVNMVRFISQEPMQEVPSIIVIPDPIA